MRVQGRGGGGEGGAGGKCLVLAAERLLQPLLVEGGGGASGRQALRVHFVDGLLLLVQLPLELRQLF
jgi:hypothetical protein